MKKFFEKLNKALIGGLTVVVVLAIGFLWWMWEPTALVPIWVLWIVILVAYVICIIVYATYSTRETNLIYTLPSVKTIHRSGAKITFIVEKNELFVGKALVSIYYQENENELETFLGVGVVVTVNSQGNLQIEFRAIQERDEVAQILKEIQNIDRHLKAIKIRPTVNEETL